jgi:hypothetical protein
VRSDVLFTMLERFKQAGLPLAAPTLVMSQTELPAPPAPAPPTPPLTQ